MFKKIRTVFHMDAQRTAVSQASTSRVGWRRLLVAVILCISSGIVTPSSVNASSCVDIEFIFARGSGESIGGPSATAWQSEIESRITDLGITYRFYDLGQTSQNGYQYPAVAIAGGVEETFTMLGAAVSGGGAFKFGDSVEQGVNELKAYMGKTLKSCPNTRFVLGGYSQGAMLLSQTLPKLDPEKIIYVATFGDPKIYLPEGRHVNSSRIHTIPEACYGKNLSQYRIYVSDCFAYEGLLGSYRPYQPVGYEGKLGTWCNKNDFICSSKFSISDHTSYVSENLYADAAQMVLQAIKAAYDIKTAIPDLGTAPLHDVAIVFDTTGSMSSLINKYKDEALQLIEQVQDDGGRVALFEYRDLGEEFTAKELCNLSCAQSELIQKINSIQPSGGGDKPESALSAIMTTLNTLDWQNGATKSIILITDAGFHNPDLDGTTLPEVVQRSLEIDPVNIYVMTVATNKTQYSELTRLTNGAVFDIDEELSFSTQTILGRPVAMLSMPSYAGLTNEPFYFDASRSYSLTNDELRYDWDLDGDGVFELENAGSSISKSYATTFDGYIQVRVSDRNGSSTMSAKLTITETYPGKTLSTITNTETAVVTEDSMKLSFQTDATRVLLALDDAPIGFIPIGNGSGQIIIQDLSRDAVATLIPYSKDGERGISREVKLLNINQSSSNDIEGNSGIDATPSDTKGSLENDAAIDNIEQPSSTTEIPKAPNTGTCSPERRKRIVTKGIGLGSL